MTRHHPRPGALGPTTCRLDFPHPTRLPEVDADCLAVGQQLGHHQQDRAATAAQVEDAFGATKPQLGQEFSPHHEFATARGGSHGYRARCSAVIGWVACFTSTSAWQPDAPIGLLERGRLFKTKLIGQRGPWRTLEHVELASAEWVD
jgi:hypothetical protein